MYTVYINTVASLGSISTAEGVEWLFKFSVCLCTPCKVTFYPPTQVHLIALGRAVDIFIISFSEKVSLCLPLSLP